MAIRVRCSQCETSYNFADTLASKKVRCKKCQGIIAVPRAEVEDVTEAIAAPPANKAEVPKSKTRPAVVRDEEDEPRPAADQHSEQKRRPKRPREEDEDDDTPPRKKHAPVEDNDYDDDEPRARKRRDEDEDEEDEPRKKKNKKKKQEAASSGILIWLLAGGGGLLAVVAMVVVAIIVMNSGGDGSAKGGKDGKDGERGGELGGRDGKEGGDQVANAGPPTVKLFVPARVGQKRRIKASLETKVGGGDHKAYFEGEVTTLEVSEGQETKVQIRADRLTQKVPGREEIEDVPPGTIIIGERRNDGVVNYTAQGTPRVTSWTIYTDKNPNAILPAFVPLTHARDADLVFGTDKKQTAGAAWKINTEEAHRFLSWKTSGLELPRDTIKGGGKLVDIFKQGGREYLDMEGQLSLEAENLPGGKVVSANLEVKYTARIPTDNSMGPVKETQYFKSIVTTMAPPNSPQKGQLVTLETTRSHTLEITYLDGSGNKGQGN